MATERTHCISCGHEFVFKAERDDEPGTVYSAAGIKETSISGFCESCFDAATEEDEEMDFTFYDYPEYDSQTAHYEKFGRPEFPNEY